MTTPPPLTQTEAYKASLALGAAQTSYAINNGGGLTAGMPYIPIDDATTMGRLGYTPLPMLAHNFLAWARENLK
jgi:hypothetical protein